MHSIQYGSKSLCFELKQSDRKSLSIEVHPDNSIKVIAPLTSSLEEIKKVVLKRSRWIVKQQNYFEQFLPRTPKHEYVSGETHFYLGKAHLLKIRSGHENTVKLKGGCFVVSLKGDYAELLVKNLLAEWYFKHAERKFYDIADEVFKKFKSYDIEKPQLQIKRMKNRWGNCRPDGTIILNPEIIKAPSKCIEYVITHELCHLIFFSHNKAFYDLLSQKIPNWEKWKLRLEQTLS